MSDFLQMNIFFFVTTAAVAVLGLLLAFIFFRLYQILTDVEHISHEWSEESALMREDIADLRRHVREQGFKLRFLRGFFNSTLGRFMRRNRKKRE